MLLQEKPATLTVEETLALSAFENYLLAARGLVPSSASLVVGYIRRLLPALSSNPTVPMAYAAIADLHRIGTKYAAMVNAANSVQHFMAFLGTPVTLSKPRKQRSPEISILSEAKVSRIFAAARGTREQFIIALLAYSGCRNRELVQLRVRDVDVARQTIRIRNGKGGKSRDCYVTGDCVELAVRYLAERRGELEDLLFVTLRHRHELQTQDIRKIVRTIATRAGISTRVWPHLFRHSLATSMINRGASVFSIQRILGHENVSTTIDYYYHQSAQVAVADYHRHAPSYI